MKKNSDITNISSDADALVKLTSKKAGIENLTFSRGNLYRPSVVTLKNVTTHGVSSEA